MDGYFDNTLNFLIELTRRKRMVLDELDQFGNCDCKKTPVTPCCLLRTELEILQKCQYTLERELWYLKGESGGTD